MLWNLAEGLKGKGRSEYFRRENDLVNSKVRFWGLRRLVLNTGPARKSALFLNGTVPTKACSPDDQSRCAAADIYKNFTS